MEKVTIRCENCERLWSVAGLLSFYEKQAMEARPCPQCGACTLSCEEPARPERRRELVKAG